MSYTTINNGSLFMNPTLYTGNGSTQSINVGFQPDFTWIKTRSGSTGTEGHRLQDAVRGSTKYLESNGTAQEGTQAQGVTSFTSTGFNLGTDGSYNYNTAPIVSWNWKAGGGQGSSNTDGSINTTYTSVNTTAGFSISKYTGTGANATIGHGLGSVPKMMIVKVLSTTNQWFVYHQALGNTKKLNLDDTSAESVQNNLWNDTTPTSSVFSVGNHTGANASGATYIAYCFAEKTGYSKFGSYTGNNNADGTFVYTGFKPAFVMFKCSTNAANWGIYDNERVGYNEVKNVLFPDLSNAENTDLAPIDLLSNGFKMRRNDSASDINNKGGATYIYMAFAEAPLVGTNNIPANAR